MQCQRNLNKQNKPYIVHIVRHDVANKHLEHYICIYITVNIGL